MSLWERGESGDGQRGKLRLTLTKEQEQVLAWTGVGCAALALTMLTIFALFVIGRWLFA